MKWHLFFEGQMSREVVASAFLGTILDQRADIRNAFFDTLADCVGAELSELFKTSSWEVTVEEHQVDIRLDSKNWVIFFENKLQTGAKQSGQLLKYYLSQIRREPAKRVVAVYLAPGAGMGDGEVADVKNSGEFRPSRDFAVRVSWDTVADLFGSPPSSDAEDQFIRNGIDAIIAAIERAAKEKFPNVGGRESIHEVASEIRQGLRQNFPGISLGAPWPAKDKFTLCSHGTNLTLWFVLEFEVKPDAPYILVALFDGDKMSLTARSMLKVSGPATRNPELKFRWKELISAGMVEVPGVGPHRLEPNGWLELVRKVAARPDSLVADLTKMGDGLLRFVDAFR